MTDTTLAERRSSLQGILKPPPFCNDSTTASSARCGLMAAAPLSVDFEIGRPLSARPRISESHWAGFLLVAGFPRESRAYIVLA
jgi:hypothetical protein